MTFEQLHLNSQITKALAICGYTKPTPIQAKSIPEILLGKDIVASAQTGTGKTAAFVLPALHQLAETKKTDNRPRVLILTPTRELATQITEAVGKYGKFLRCNIASLVGGMPYRQQLRNLSRPMDIIVATPGRLMDHMNNGRLDLSGIQMLVLDEADRMLDMGFIDDVQTIASAMPKDRQTLLFSATVDNRLTQIIRQFLKNPERIEIESEKLAPTKITQELYLADHPQHKMQLLNHLIKELNIFKGIIFTATKINADKLADALYEQGYAAAPLHGDLKQSMRNRTLEQLRRGKIQFLVATDVAARGIDIQDITHVINFDLPKFSEDYVHRIGRTGRAGKEGLAISLALPSDARHIQRIERLLRQTLDRKVVAGLEPKKQLSSGNSSTKKSKGKKKYNDKSSYKGKKEFARKDFSERKPKKQFDDKREGFAPRKPKKHFDDKREDFAPRKPKKHFDDKREDFAPRKPKKRFDDKREDFAPRKPKKRFDDKREDFTPHKPKKRFDDKREDFAPRKPKKRFDDNRESTRSDKPRVKFGQKREGFASSDKPKKKFSDKRDSFGSPRSKKKPSAHPGSSKRFGRSSKKND